MQFTSNELYMLLNLPPCGRGLWLRGADLSGAKLGAANLSGADLSGAKVTPEQLVTAKTLECTTMPDGTRRP